MPGMPAYVVMCTSGSALWRRARSAVVDQHEHGIARPGAGHDVVPKTRAVASSRELPRAEPRHVHALVARRRTAPALVPWPRKGAGRTPISWPVVAVLLTLAVQIAAHDVDIRHGVRGAASGRQLATSGACMDSARLAPRRPVALIPSLPPLTYVRACMLWYVHCTCCVTADDNSSREGHPASAVCVAARVL